MGMATTSAKLDLVIDPYLVVFWTIIYAVLIDELVIDLI